MSKKLFLDKEVFKHEVITLMDNKGFENIFFVVKDCKKIEDGKYEVTLDLYENWEKKVCH
ncbi:MAG TPA: hypothetical protein VK590_04715 [Saprospiraceae bacterium]|nr:hypothetical protein [Saprospiraceae bacterium]